MITFTPKISRYQLVSLLILLLAGALRFLKLDYPPLQDLEAIAGLRAAMGTPGATAFAGLIELDLHQPALENMMRFVFQLFGTGVVNARIVPAIAGLLLVLTPHLARKRLGPGTSLAFSFLIAISPIFITFSRTASGMSLGLLGVSTWVMTNLEGERKNLSAAGIGLALASGPSIFNGLLLVAIVGLTYKFTSKQERAPLGWPSIWVVLIVIGILVTSLGWSFHGISDFFESIGEYIRGWRSIGPYPISALLAILPIYAPLLTLFSILGIWKSLGEQSPFGLAALITVFFGLALLVLYRQRGPEEIGWIAWFLMFLAADYLAGLINTLAQDGIHSSSLLIGLTLLVLFLGLGVQLSKFLNDPTLQEQSVGLLIFIASLGGILVLVGTFSLGWRWSESRIGILAAFGIGFLFLSVSSTWHLNFRPFAGSSKELWRDNVSSDGLFILENTLETVAEMTKGIQGSLSVDFYDPPPPSVLWALRNDGTLYSSAAGDSADVVLAREGDRELNLAEDYLGQSLSLGESWGWLSALPPDFLRWWFDRDPPVVSHRWWVLFRSDLVLDPVMLDAGDS